MRYSPLLVLLLALLPSCGDVPDVQPFTKATADMGVAVEGGLQQVVSDLQRGAQLRSLSAEDKKQLQQDQQQLAQLATAFAAVARSFDEYASALNQVAAAGEKREAAIQKVSAATDKLVAASQSFAAAAPYAALLGPLTKALADAASELNRVHTTNKLAKLASPEQEAVIERTAQLLSAVIGQFAQVDASVYNLLLDNDAAQDNALLIAGERRKLTDATAYLLRRILQAETILLRNPPRYGGLSDGKSGPLDELMLLDKDPRQLLTSAFLAYKSDPKNLAKQGQLFDVLKDRENRYSQLLASLQSASISAQASWDTLYTVPKKRSAAVLQKSQELLEAWADSHHELRLALLQAKNVSAQDLVAQGQKVQQLIADLKAAQAAAAASADKDGQTTKDDSAANGDN
jgi:hypothetical protein